MIPNDLKGQYLDLLERALTNSIYGESQVELRIQSFWQRLRHPYLTRRGALPWPTKAHTMIGPQRLNSLRTLMVRALEDRVAGDFIETGVWRGGACILMRGVLRAYGITDRKVYVADSFEGLPKPNAAKYPADKRDRLFGFSELAVSEASVRKNFDAYGLLDEQVIFLKGFFRDTLPKLDDARFALIRLDGDMYESTMDALVNLYDRLSPKGYIIIDDYGGLSNCKNAVHDFLASRKLSPEICPVDSSCVWWQKAT